MKELDSGGVVRRADERAAHGCGATRRSPEEHPAVRGGESDWFFSHGGGNAGERLAHPLVRGQVDYAARLRLPRLLMVGMMTAPFKGVGVFGRRGAQIYVRMVRASFGKVVVELGPESGQQQ